MQYQHPEWIGKAKRDAWKKYAWAAGILILAILGVLLIPGWLKAANTVFPGAASATPRSAESTTQTPPPPETTARAFLDGWQSRDYAKMYSLLSPLSREAVSEEEFGAFYEDVRLQSTLRNLDYKILSVELTPTEATVGFEVTLHTILVGDITAQTRMLMKNPDGAWKVAWDAQTALPELDGGKRLVMYRDYPARGSIYDRKGLALASEAETVNIGIVPAEITDEDGVLSALAAALHTPRELIRRMYADAPPNDYLPIGDANREDMAGRFTALSTLGGVYLNTSTTRYYYGGGVASHVVGYTRKISPERLAEFQSLGYSGNETVGETGLERSAEKDLAGAPGGRLMVTSPTGDALSVLASSDPRSAMDVYTTLDRDLQTQIERTVMGTYNGAVVVLNRNTGEVLAMTSSPRFDGNLFTPGSYNGAYLLNDILADPDGPLTNRATAGLYPLGSVFKIITLAAGLESGLFIMDSPYDDETGYFYGPNGFVGTDWTVEKEMKPHGKITLEQCLVQSCNPCFWNVGLSLFEKDPGSVPDTARAFGLGSATGIPGLDEFAGSVPGPAEGAEWTSEDALNQAVGQGGLLVTPLQAADFVAAVGNGGTLYRPQVLLSIRPPEGEAALTFAPVARGRLPVNPTNLQAIQRAMRGVIYDPKGTAQKRFSVISNTVKIAGKTGTAESGRKNPHSWFVAYTFNEGTSKPDIAVAVVAEDAGEGSVYAARMVRRVIEIYFIGRPASIYPWESEYGVRGTDTPTATGETTPTLTPENPL